MDFPADRDVWDVDDEYMFGPGLPGRAGHRVPARATREVYLPAGHALVRFRQRPQPSRAASTVAGRRAAASACRCSSAPARSCRSARRCSTPTKDRRAPDHAPCLCRRRRRTSTSTRTTARSRQYLNGAWSPHPAPLRRGDRHAHHRPARGPLSGHGRNPHLPHRLAPPRPCPCPRPRRPPRRDGPV